MSDEKVRECPAREPWEEPPPDGWEPSLRGVGFAVLRFALSIVAAALAVRAHAYAARLERHHAHGFDHALGVGLWCVSLVLLASVIVYAWRRLGGLATVAAMLTDHGRTGRLGGRPPVWLDAPPDGALRIAHLSDLHCAEDVDVRLCERKAPAGNARALALLDATRLASDEVLVVTGDITDRGTARAWRWFEDALARRGLADRTVLVPGNHDIGLVDHVDDGERARALRNDRFGIVHLANLMKFCDAFSRTLGGRTGWVHRRAATSLRPEAVAAAAARGELRLGADAVPFADAWRDVERDVRPLVESLPTRPVPSLRARTIVGDLVDRGRYVRAIERARARLSLLFPVAVPLPGRGARPDAVLFVLNSSTVPSRHPATNALGWIGRPQLRRLEALAEVFPQPIRLVAQHHHLVRRGEERSIGLVAAVMAKFQVLADAWRVADFCRAHGVRAVLNGHRHLSYQLRLPSGTVLLAAASASLGDELAGDPRPQLERWSFAPAPTDVTVGIHRETVRLDGDAALHKAAATAASRSP